MAGPGSVVVQFVAKADKAARDVATFTKKLVGLETAADKVDDGLRDAQRALDTTGDKAAAAAPDLQRAETALDAVADEAATTATRLRTEAGNMASAMRTGTTGITTEATSMKTQLGTVGKEGGAEFVSNIAEGIGSGQANLADVVTGTMGGLTNLVSTLTGPVGIAASVAAAGIGLVFSAVKGEADKVQESIDALTTQLSDLHEMASATAGDIIWKQWMTDIQKVDGAMGNIVDGLDAAGISAEDFQAAIKGDHDAQQRVLTALTKSGTAISDNVKKTGTITPEQQKQLENLQDVREEIEKQNTKLDGTADNLDDINRLTGENSDVARTWRDDYADVKHEAKGIKDEVNDIPSNKTVTVTVKTEGKGYGSGSGLYPGQGSVMGRAAEPPTVVNVYATGTGIPTSPRALVDLLETHTVRMGRKPGRPRAVAW